MQCPSPGGLVVRPPHSEAAGVLPVEFYRRPVLDVARSLIGCVVEHRAAAGMIVETEAYHESEPACHAHIGLTPRTRTLFGAPGRAYVYRSYGIHALLNAVCEEAGVGAAVLIRALEPLRGVGRMRERRAVQRREDLCSGPGKLTAALAVELLHNGCDLTRGPVTTPTRCAAGPASGSPRPPICRGVSASPRTHTYPAHGHSARSLSFGSGPFPSVGSFSFGLGPFPSDWSLLSFGSEPMSETAVCGRRPSMPAPTRASDGRRAGASPGRESDHRIVAMSGSLSTAPPAQIDWWHQIELPGGHVTPGPDRSTEKLAALRLPDLTGKTVLDVGALDGYFSFAAERRGASRVVALDTYMWRKPGGRDGFEYARRALCSNVESVEVEVLDICPETVGHFDVVLFLGVLYHMRHPLLALERIASVTDELLVLETLVDLTFLRSPAAAFYPWAMLGDDTNWWGPNRAAVMGMLHSAGFAQAVAYPARRVTRARLRGMPARARINSNVASNTPAGSRLRLLKDVARSAFTQNRLVAHAWK
jgi:DNA-3-methyladenine glycosylase